MGKEISCITNIRNILEKLYPSSSTEARNDFGVLGIDYFRQDNLTNLIDSIELDKIKYSSTNNDKNEIIKEKELFNKLHIVLASRLKQIFCVLNKYEKVIQCNKVNTLIIFENVIDYQYELVSSEEYLIPYLINEAIAIYKLTGTLDKNTFEVVKRMFMYAVANNKNIEINYCVNFPFGNFRLGYPLKPYTELLITFAQLQNNYIISNNNDELDFCNKILQYRSALLKQL